MLYPLLAALISAGDTIFEKTIFDHKRKKYKLFVPFIFLFAFLILSIFFYPFWGEIKSGAFSFLMLFLLFIVVILASAGNLFYYYGFQKEGLSEIQPFLVFSPLLTIILAGIIYPDERNIKIFILALVAGFALVFSHIEKKHLKFDKGLIPIMGAVFLGAIETNIIKELLHFYSPVAMYTVRTGLVALFLFLFVHPSVKEMLNDGFKKLIIVSFMWVLVMVFVYYGFQTVGVVYTVLTLMLAPVLVLIGSRFILKEKRIRKRDLVALFVVLICVVAAQIIK